MTFELDRFAEAQAPVYAAVLAELAAGRKRTHWMWFIFPQFAGLGHSPMAGRFAIRSRAEAEAYLAHPVLGPRLVECATAALTAPPVTAHEIFGSPDDNKLRSSMTLFGAIPGADPVFAAVLARYFGGIADSRTLELLDGDP